MTLLAYIIRILLVLLLARLVFRFVAGLIAGLRGGNAARQIPRAAPAAGQALVRDRVCNTFVPRERALAATIDGQQEYFCSEECRRKALTS